MRAFGVATAVVLVSLGTAACSPGQSTPDTTLQVMMADDWAGTPAVLDVVRDFELEHPGVRVDVVPRPFNQIPDEAEAAIASGQPVDVIHHHAFAAGATGLAVPLGELWEDGTFDVEDYFPGAVEDIAWGDRPYGVPLDVNALFVIHDDAVVAPRTFEEVRALAQTAAEEGPQGLTVSANSWEAYGWICANGGEVVEVADDGTPTFTLDAAPVVEALGFLGDLVGDGLAHGPLARVSTDAFELFGAGETLLLTSGTWSVAALEESFPQRGYGTAPMPGGDAEDPPCSALGGSSLFIGRGSTSIDLAVAFIQALTTDEVAVRLALEEGRFPPRPDLYDQLDEAPGAQPLAQQLESARPMKLIAFPEAEAAFTTALEEVLTGRADAAEALGRAQLAAEASVAES